MSRPPQAPSAASSPSLESRALSELVVLVVLHGALSRTVLSGPLPRLVQRSRGAPPPRWATSVVLDLEVQPDYVVLDLAVLDSVVLVDITLVDSAVPNLVALDSVTLVIL
eukprot:1263752-Pyramimonas_sp.AAC.1